MFQGELFSCSDPGTPVPTFERIAMEDAEVHIMHHAGRLRMALHGYNTVEDVEKFFEVLKKTLN